MNLRCKVSAVLASASLALLFCNIPAHCQSFTAQMSNFVFNQQNGSWSCRVAGTGDLQGIKSAGGTFTPVPLGPVTTHVFINGETKLSPDTIIYNGSLLVSHDSRTLPDSSMEITFVKKNGATKKYLITSQGTYTADDFSDLKIGVTGNQIN